MLIRDNQGNIIGEINTSITGDGKVVTANTVYDDGRPVSQNISIRYSQGRVETTDILGNKILP